MTDKVAEKLPLLPSCPGVYKMYDAEGEVIYVGKAINLKNRVSQYFHASKAHTAKVLAMVSHVADFETIQVRNETEALSLESNLIKQFKPKYNILLKDDKHFPYLRIDMRQDFPRIETVRRLKNDGARYLGPFISGYALKEGMDAVRRHFPLRHCKKDLKAAMARRERPCLMYHVGKCCAPCSGNVNREAYHAMLEEVCSFLTGNTDEVISSLKRRMQEAADSMAFEQAATCRDSIRAIEQLKEKQSVISTRHTMEDVFAPGRQDGNLLIYALFVRDGKVIGSEKFRMDADEPDTDEEVLEAFLTQYYAEMEELPKEILVPCEPTHSAALENWLSRRAGRKIAVLCPQRGEKAALVALAKRNCLDVLEKDATLQKRAWERGEGALAELSGILGLETVPVRIECFDNSHFMGRDAVSSMVVFTNAQPDKKAYRRFKLLEEHHGDDLQAMREVLTRRFTRYSEGAKGFDELPDLLLIDGGIAQLAIAEEVLFGFSLSYLPCAALAEEHEILYLSGAASPYRLPKNSAPLHLLERIRDEAHRFAISYHRNLKNKGQVFSILDEIEGIGEKRKRALFDRFLTLEQIRAATVEELCAVDGMNLPAARSVYAHFHPGHTPLNAAPSEDGD